MSRKNSAVRQSEGLLFLVSFHEEIANLLNYKKRHNRYLPANFWGSFEDKSHGTIE